MHQRAVACAARIRDDFNGRVDSLIRRLFGFDPSALPSLAAMP